MINNFINNNFSYKNKISFKRPLKILLSKIKELFFWQEFVIKEFFKEKYLNIISPCGSGKSTLQISLAILDVVNFGCKQLFLVPQNHISSSFLITSINIFGITYNWKISPNNILTNESFKIKRLKKWLLTPSDHLYKGGTDIGSIAAICTYQTFLLTWNSLTKQEKNNALKNLTLRIDESHHLENLGNKSQITELSKVINYIIKHSECKIHLTSATFFRGDDYCILHPKIKILFKTYRRDFLEHFKTLEIKEVFINFIETKNIINDIIENIKKEPKENHLIIIPPKNQKFRKYSKTIVEDLIKELKILGYKDEEIMNWVDQSTQKKNKRQFLKNSNNIKIVITCMLGREGTDWIQCSRIHHTAIENSARLAAQTFGRLLRFCPGKKKIGVYYYIPEITDESKKSKNEQKKDKINEIIISQMITENFNPTKVFSFNKNKKIQKPYLQDYFTDYECMIKKLIFFYDSLEKNKENFLKISNKICDIFHIIENDRELVSNGLMLKLISFGKTKKRYSLKIKLSIENVKKYGYDFYIKQYNFDNFQCIFDKKTVDILMTKEVINFYKKYKKIPDRNNLKLYYWFDSTFLRNNRGNKIYYDELVKMISPYIDIKSIRTSFDQKSENAMKKILNFIDKNKKLPGKKDDIYHTYSSFRRRKFILFKKMLEDHNYAYLLTPLENQLKKNIDDFKKECVFCKNKIYLPTSTSKSFIQKMGGYRKFVLTLFGNSNKLILNTTKNYYIHTKTGIYQYVGYIHGKNGTKEIRFSLKTTDSKIALPIIDFIKDKTFRNNRLNPQKIYETQFKNNKLIK